MNYKGFDKDLKCMGFQYEVGKEYEESEVKICEKGFHACENPLEVFKFYPPADSRYCEVKQSGELSKVGNNSKVASSKIKIGAEIGLSGIINAGVKFILEKVNFKNNKKSNTGDHSVATNTGDFSAATNTGDGSAATNTGDGSAATNTGDLSVATNTGYQSVATNTGRQSAATNTGDWSAATNTGKQSAATNTGDWSAATNTGDWSAATNTGYRSAATNTGDGSAATNTGDWSAAIVEGKDSVAISIGYQSKAKASLGSAIVVVERGKWNGNTYPLKAICSAIVDGEKIKADTFYTVKDGVLVEAE